MPRFEVKKLDLTGLENTSIYGNLSPRRGIDYTKSEKRLNTQIELDHMYDSGKLSKRDTEREDGDDGGKVRREM